MDEKEIKEIMKQAHKEAMREWLDERFAEFGRWAFMAFIAALFVAFIYFMLAMNGWTQRGAP